MKETKKGIEKGFEKFIPKGKTFTRKQVQELIHSTFVGSASGFVSAFHKIKKDNDEAIEITRKEICHELDSMYKSIKKVEIKNGVTSALLIAYIEIDRIKNKFKDSQNNRRVNKE